MGLWNDLKEIARLSSVDGSKDYRKRAIMGMDITSGKSYYQTPSKKDLRTCKGLQLLLLKIVKPF